MRIVLFQPDIPQNLGGALRLCACLGVGLEIIEPCGFPLSTKALRRAALDYGDPHDIRRHSSWEIFVETQARAPGRLLLFTTRAPTSYLDARYEADDWLLFGSETRGAPEAAHALAAARLRIPLVEGARSLNLVVAAGIGLSEALRQIRARGAAAAD